MQENLSIKDNTFKNISFLIRKIEKLTCAVYKVTSFMEDKECLKWQIREISSNVLNSLASRISDSLSSGSNVLDKVSGEINGLISLFEVAKSSGVVSEMNFSIIQKEYGNVKKNIDILRGAEFDMEELLDSQEIRFSEMNILEDSSPSRILYKGHIKDNKKDIDNKGHIGQTSIKNDNVKHEYSPRNKSLPDSSNSNRGATIIDFVRKNGSSSIKDIAQVVTDCSEKTIQRELAKLVSKGVLEKRGERRWSKYSISR